MASKSFDYYVEKAEAAIRADTSCAFALLAIAEALGRLVDRLEEQERKEHADGQTD